MVSPHKGTFSIIFILMTADVVGDIWCDRFGLWPFRSVAISVCGRSGLWPFRFVAVPVCGRFGQWPFRFVAVYVCGRFGLWPFQLWPFRFVAVMTCYPPTHPPPLYCHKLYQPPTPPLYCHKLYSRHKVGSITFIEKWKNITLIAFQYCTHFAFCCLQLWFHIGVFPYHSEILSYCPSA